MAEALRADPEAAVALVVGPLLRSTLRSRADVDDVDASSG